VTPIVKAAAVEFRAINSATN